MKRLCPSFVRTADLTSIVSLDGRTVFVKTSLPDRFEMFVGDGEPTFDEIVILPPDLVGSLLGWDRDCDFWSEQEKQAHSERVKQAVWVAAGGS